MDCTDNTDGWGSSSPNFLKRLSISQTHIDYHDAFYRIIQRIRDRVIADNLDLSDLERGILIGVVAFSPRLVPQSVNEFHDLLSLTATSRHGFEEINIQINLIGLHWRLFGV